MVGKTNYIYILPQREKQKLNIDVRYSSRDDGAIFWVEHSVVWWIDINFLKIIAASFFSLSTSVLRFLYFAFVMIDGRQSNSTQSMV
jgi:hypothetical protein